jgi:hypothetical protein
VPLSRRRTVGSTPRADRTATAPAAERPHQAGRGRSGGRAGRTGGRGSAGRGRGRPPRAAADDVADDGDKLLELSVTIAIRGQDLPDEPWEKFQEFVETQVSIYNVGVCAQMHEQGTCVYGL